MRKLMILTALLGVLLASTSFGAQLGLVVNGDFEEGNTGWVVSGGLTGIGSNPNHTLGGSMSASFGNITVDGFVVQSTPIATVSGQQYEFSFWLRNDGASSNDFSAYFGGSQVLGILNDGTFGYTFYDYTVTATSSSTQLLFLGRNVPSWFYLDDVSVTALNDAHNGNGSTVPEPATMILLGSGLVGMAAYGRRRLKK